MCDLKALRWIQLTTHDTGYRSSMKLLYRAVFAVSVLFVAGCGSLGGLRPAPTPVVGDPLIFDGSRLLSEFSERRLQIDEAIKKASVEDVDTTARLVSASSFGLDVNFGRNANEGEIASLLSSQEAGIAQNENTIELQNVYLDSIKADLERREQLYEQEVSQSNYGNELATIELRNYRQLVAYYSSILNDPELEDDDENKKIAAEKLVEIRKTVPGVVQAGAFGNFALPELPTAATAGNGPSTPADPKIGISAAQAQTDQLIASLENLGKAQEKLAPPSSTRRDQFQQFQSYLDELYSYRSRYLLDDGHRSLNRRIVRVIFPIYVPPSSSTRTSNVQFRINPVVKGSNANPKYDELIQLTALIDALNDLAGDIDDDARYLTDVQIVNDGRRMYELLKALRIQEKCDAAQINSSKESVLINNLLSLKGKRDDLNKIRGIEDGLTDIEIMVQIEEKEKIEIKIDNAYRAWDLLNAARRVGFDYVAQNCLNMDATNGWVSNSGDIAFNSTASVGSDEENASARAKQTSQSIQVYALNPIVEREKIDQTISRIRSLNASFGESFGDAKEIGSASAGVSIANQLLAQAANVSPIIAAFQKKVMLNGKSQTVFGWSIYPRLTVNARQKLRTKHVGTNFFGSADLIVPLSLDELTISIKANGDTFDSKPIPLPRVPYDEVFASITSIPTVRETKEYGIVDPSKQFTVLVQGYNLWNSPTVFVGGRAQDGIQFISGSENAVRAVFNNLKGVTCDYHSVNYDREDLVYAKKPLKPLEKCAAKIWVYTATGRDYVGSLVIDKKQKSKEEAAVTATLKRGDIIKSADTEQLKITWEDQLKSAVSEKLKSSSVLKIKDTRSRFGNSTVQLKYIGKETIGKTDEHYALGTNNSNFCLSESGKGYEPRCSVELHFGKILVAKGQITLSDPPEK